MFCFYQAYTHKYLQNKTRICCTYTFRKLFSDDITSVNLNNRHFTREERFNVRTVKYICHTVYLVIMYNMLLGYSGPKQFKEDR